MSVLEMVSHAKSVRQRLRNPPNSVRDLGIDLKRKPEPMPELAIESAPPNRKPVIAFGRIVSDFKIVYGEDGSQRGRVPTIRAIQLAACNHYGLNLVELVSHRRTKDIVFARQVAMTVVKRTTGYSLPFIARHFGGRDHTTILHGVRKIEALCRTDPQLRGVVESLVQQTADPTPSVSTTAHCFSGIAPKLCRDGLPSNFGEGEV